MFFNRVSVICEIFNTTYDIWNFTTLIANCVLNTYVWYMKPYGRMSCTHMEGVCMANIYVHYFLIFPFFKQHATCERTCKRVVGGRLLVPLCKFKEVIWVLSLLRSLLHRQNTHN